MSSILEITALYFLNFEKADCTIFALLVGRLVGWLVSRSVGGRSDKFLKRREVTLQFLTEHLLPCVVPLLNDDECDSGFVVGFELDTRLADGGQLVL